MGLFIEEHMIRSGSHDHTPEAIALRLSEVKQGSYLRDFIYGGIDGSITTFALVSGIVGAELAPKAIIILGIANLAADGFSMAVSNFMGTKSEQDEWTLLEELERKQVIQSPEGEKEEVRQIFAQMGLSGKVLEDVVDSITSDTHHWVQIMLRQEYGLPAAVRSPWKAGAFTFGAFLLCGAAPLIPYFVNAESPFIWASVMTGGVFFLIGSIRSIWSVSIWWKEGLFTFLVGATASVLSFGVGRLFR
jgi:vacuolar iron transporter family protein